MELFSSLNQLLFPNRCISCGTLGLSLCTSCRRGWNSHIYRTSITRSEKVSVTSSVLYSDVAQKIILSAKERHFKAADLLVASAIAHSIKDVLRTHWIDTLVPIPSRKSAARLRGRQFIEDICQVVVREIPMKIATPLKHHRKVFDQSGLHLEERWNNLTGAFVVEGNQEHLGRVLLVDDLVTTGATLAEAARALRYAEIEVIGAVTAALAQPVR